MSRKEEQRGRCHRRVLLEALSQERVRAACSKIGRAYPSDFGEHRTLDSNWLEAAGLAAEVSRPTLQKMLDGEVVSAATIHGVCKALGLRPMDLVDRSAYPAVPRDAADYLALMYGYYVGEERVSRGEEPIRWFSETLSLRPAGRRRPPADQTLLVVGECENQLGVRFELKGFLAGDAFSLVATLTPPSRKGAVAAGVLWPAFTAVFNACLGKQQLVALNAELFADVPGDGRVLTGYWQGMTVFGTLALYPMICSTWPFDPARAMRQLNALSVARKPILHEGATQMYGG